MPRNAQSLLRVSLAAIAMAGVAACGTTRTPPLAPPPVVAAAPQPPPLHLLLRLDERRLYVIDDDPATPVKSFPIAVGKPGTETPTGTFAVEEMEIDPEFPVIDPKDRTRLIRMIPPGPNNPIGVRWIGFMHDEKGKVGIHGTPKPELIGRAVSNGCVRMRNEDVLYVYERVQVGTPVIVE